LAPNHAEGLGADTLLIPKVLSFIEERLKILVYGKKSL
jgi:hypothetical protein